MQGSPVRFDVLASAASPSMCSLLMPPNADALEPDYERPAVVTLRTFDKHGNPCSTGGLYPTGRLMLVKNDEHDGQQVHSALRTWRHTSHNAHRADRLAKPASRTP